MITKKIGFIGCGNMAGAILYGALKSNVLEKENAYVYDISSSIMKKTKEWDVNQSASPTELCQDSDIIILAVKPQNIPEVLESCGNSLDGKAIISIAAGVTSERLRDMIKGNARILRVMPNAPAMVFEGAMALCSDNDLTEKENVIASELFESIGIVEWIPEKSIDAVCGLSGGGPAYAAAFIEALSDGGVKQGLPRATAYRLAAQTCLGAAKMILEMDMHPGVLKDMVTSPGGTTIEGMEALERGGMRYAVMDCIRAASEKSKKL